MYTFKLKDMPNNATHCDQEECGFSLYRGVLIQWDEDHDMRIYTLLDMLPSYLLDTLQVVQEHEGVVEFLWKYNVHHEGYQSGNSIEMPDGDVWTVN